MQDVDLFAQYSNLKVLKEKYECLYYYSGIEYVENLLDISKLLYPFEFLFNPDQPYRNLQSLLSATFVKSGIYLDSFIDYIYYEIQNLELDEEFFEKFSKFYDYRIRRAIARNKYAPTHILENLSKDIDSEVSHYAILTLDLITKSNSNDG